MHPPRYLTQPISDSMSDGDDGVLSWGIAGSLDASTSADKARCNSVGSVLPLFSARRRIPAHAVELKKYLSGIEPVTSTCDNEHTLAALGQADILGVDDPPRDCPLGSKHNTSVRPSFPCRLERQIFSGKRCKEIAERIVAHRQDAWDILPNCDAGGGFIGAASVVDCIKYLHETEGELSARVGETAAATGDREALARRSADEDVGRFDDSGYDLRRDFRHVTEVRHIGKAIG